MSRRRASPGHWLIEGARDLTIDGQGSILNFASPVVAGVTIGSSQRMIFRLQYRLAE
ncbi:hypothetical protein ABIB73_001133 [Bradyrhizobium sp. F1.4.3]|uniref:hypothetical protein n=1 Tax=Bradyrhizobium sp. F1.4.3 TaxID=3156356 RepID=UPI00339913D7